MYTQDAMCATVFMHKHGTMYEMNDIRTKEQDKWNFFKLWHKSRTTI